MKRSAALKASVLLSLLFLSVYGGCNWVASHRTNVGSLFFAWERQIPFIPWMIVPYMSIDLFFVTAPFLCRGERELSLLARRLTFAVLVAAVCFLLFPLRFAFERSHVSGWLGTIFNGFRMLDAPYNLVPSLHIAILATLAPVYLRRCQGILRFGLIVWFGLIALSTLLTYQHHVVDVLGGAALAICGFYAFPEHETRLPVLQNPQIGSYYLAASALIAVTAVWFWPWGSLLLWPALSLAIVGSAYFGIGPGIFRKTEGRIPLSAGIMLHPCLLGQHLSLLYYRQQCRKWDEVVPGLLMGRKLTSHEANEAIRCGVTAVLDLTGEFSEASPFLAVKYLNIAVLDLTAPTQEQLAQMARFIAKHIESGKVYVHCKIGYSRSAAAVGAFLLTTGQIGNPAEVLALLSRARPSLIVRPEVIEALNCFARRTVKQPVELACGEQMNENKVAHFETP
jgi:protein-tyrosine phosphatase/membrane-associated phospholipid phosphatase